jgi:hypothetical protein
MDNEPQERWTNHKRSDGCQIVIGLDGYLIMPNSEGLPVDRCPCCKKPFENEGEARVVADYVFEMVSD